MASGLKKQSLADILGGSAPVSGGLAGISNGGLLAGVCESIGALSAGPTSRRDRDPGNDIAALTRSPGSFGLG